MNSVLHPQLSQEKLNKAVRRIQKTVIERAGHCKLSDIQEGLAQACGVKTWHALCAGLAKGATGTAPGSEASPQSAATNTASPIGATVQRATARLELNQAMSELLERRRNEAAHWPTFHHLDKRPTPAFLAGVTIGALLDTMNELWRSDQTTLDEQALAETLGFFCLLLPENGCALQEDATYTGPKVTSKDIASLLPPCTDQEIISEIAAGVQRIAMNPVSGDATERPDSYLLQIEDPLERFAHPLAMTLVMLHRQWLATQSAEALSPLQQVDRLLLALDPARPARCIKRTDGHCVIVCLDRLERAAVRELAGTLGTKVKALNHRPLPYKDLTP